MVAEKEDNYILVAEKEDNYILVAEKETKKRKIIHFLKNCTLKTRTSSEIILESTKQHSRCSCRTFKMFLQKVRPLIERQDTKLREAISAAERLAVTLRFLATDFPFPTF